MPNQAPNKTIPYHEEHANTLFIEEKCTSLYGNLPASIGVSLVIAIILSIAHWDAIGHAEVIIWNLILGGTLVARLVTWIFWHYTRHAYSYRLWIILFRIQVWLAGIAWGLSAWFLFSQDSAIHQALLAFSIAGVASGSLTSLTIDKYSAIGFVFTTVFPLSITLHQESGPGAFYMLVMSILFMFFVISSTNRAQQTAQNRILQNIELTNLANELKNKQNIEDIIRSSQSIFIQDKNSFSSLHYILHQILKLSNSAIGFIGKINTDEHDKLYMKALIFAGAGAAEKEIIDYQQSHLPPGGEFHNLDNLFGSAITSGKPVISNAPQRDLRSGGYPSGHPVLKTFMSLPIYSDDEKIAVICLANKPNGYSDDDLDQLTPMLNTIAQFVQAVSNEEDHARDKAALVESSLSNKIILDNVSDGIITINKHGKIQSFNHAAETIFGYKREKVLHKNVNMLMPDNEKIKHQDYVNQYLKTQKGSIIDKGREVTGLRKNGETFPMDLFISMVMHNNEPMFIGVVRDNSENSKSRTKKQDAIQDVIKELALQQLTLSVLRHQEGKGTSSRPNHRHDNIYRLITSHFFIENNHPKTTVSLIRKLKEVVEPIAAVLPSGSFTFLADERRSSLSIDCDETLLDVSVCLLINNLVHLGLEQVSLNVFEEKSMAKISLEANIGARASTDPVDATLFSINGHCEKNAKTIPALLALYNGKASLQKINDRQLSIYIEFPQTINLH